MKTEKRIVLTSALSIYLISLLTKGQAQQVQIRLSGGNATAGRVEVQREGTWGTICDDEFDATDALVVCRMLGLNNGGVVTTEFGPGTGPIWMDNLRCDGSEANITQCVFNGWGITDCAHSEDAGVVCAASGVTATPTGPSTTLPPATVQPNNCGSVTTPGTPTNGDVRIVGPSNLRGIGFVEVYYNGQWGAVCDDFWGTNNARVVCGQLCFDPNVARAGAPVEVNYVRENVSSNIFLDDVRCDGTETRLSQCNASAWNVTNCARNEIVSVSCVQLDESAPDPPLPVLECENGLLSASFSRQADANLEEKHINVFSGICADATKATDPNYVTIRIPFDRCGTNTEKNETHIVYNNTIRYDYTSFEGSITRVNTYRVEVSCEFPRALDVDRGVRPLTETVTQRSPGQYVISMTFFRNNSFNTPVNTYPVNLTLGEWLNVALTLEAIDANLKLVVPNCTATPSTDANDNVNYPLFEERCANDPTLAFFPLNSTSFGYRFQTFKFVQFDTLFIHCGAFVCLATEKDSQCDRSCNASTSNSTDGSRRKRDTSDILRARETYHVMSPPLMFGHFNASNAIVREWSIASTTPMTTRLLHTTSRPTTDSPTATPSRHVTTQSTTKISPTTVNPSTTAQPTSQATSRITSTTIKPTTSTLQTTKVHTTTTSTTTTQPTTSTAHPTTQRDTTTHAQTTKPTTTSLPTTDRRKTTEQPSTTVASSSSEKYATTLKMSSAVQTTKSAGSVVKGNDDVFNFEEPFVAGMGAFIKSKSCTIFHDIYVIFCLLAVSLFFMIS